MGACYVKIPQVNRDIFWAGPQYPYQPMVATVEVAGADRTESFPQPTASDTGGYDWTCYDNSNPKVSVKSQCPGLTVVAATWAGSYTQMALLLVGALIAIAAERWFHSASHEDEEGSAHKADPSAADGGGSDDAGDPDSDADAEVPDRVV